MMTGEKQLVECNACVACLDNEDSNKNSDVVEHKFANPLGKRHSTDGGLGEVVKNYFTTRILKGCHAVIDLNDFHLLGKR